MYEESLDLSYDEMDIQSQRDLVDLSEEELFEESNSIEMLKYLSFKKIFNEIFNS